MSGLLYDLTNGGFNPDEYASPGPISNALAGVTSQPPAAPPTPVLGQIDPATLAAAMQAIPQLANVPAKPNPAAMALAGIGDALRARGGYTGTALNPLLEMAKQRAAALQYNANQQKEALAQTAKNIAAYHVQQAGLANKAATDIAVGQAVQAPEITSREKIAASEQETRKSIAHEETVQKGIDAQLAAAAREEAAREARLARADNRQMMEKEELKISSAAKSAAMTQIGNYAAGQLDTDLKNGMTREQIGNHLIPLLAASRAQGHLGQEDVQDIVDLWNQIVVPRIKNYENDKNLLEQGRKKKAAEMQAADEANMRRAADVIKGIGGGLAMAPAP